MSTPQNSHLRVYWHSSFGLAKASKVCAATWHMICNSWREMPGPIFYTQVMRKAMARFANSDCCWHILDVKIDLVPNLHSVAKSAGSWVQEKIERDTAALNLHSSYWRNATGPLEQYHNERPPAPETKTFQGWHGHRSYIKLYRVKHGTSQTSHLQPPGPGRPSWRSCCGMSEFLIQEKNDRNPWNI